MTSRDAILNYIQREFVDGKSTEQITVEDGLLLSGLLGSMEIIRLVAFLEDEYDLTIPPEDIVIEHFESVDAIYQYLTSQ